MAGRELRKPLHIEAEALNSTRVALRVLVVAPLAAVAIALATRSFVPLVAILLTAAIAIGFRRRIQQELIWDRPWVEFAFSPPLLGERASFTYIQHSKRPVDVAGGELHITLTCTERTVKDDDSNSRVVATSETLYPVQATAEGIRVDAAIEIPMSAGGPSLNLPSNRIEWQLETRLSGPSLPSGSETFDVYVAPSIAPRARSQPQDTSPGTSDRALPRLGRYRTNIRLEAEHVEIASDLKGHVDFEPNHEEADRVRGLRLDLMWRTEGKGDTERALVGRVALPADEQGGIAMDWHIPIPPHAPISYDGETIKVIYELRARLDVRRGLDGAHDAMIVVTPEGGRGLYDDGPHPVSLA